MSDHLSVARAACLFSCRPSSIASLRARVNSRTWWNDTISIYPIESSCYIPLNAAILTLVYLDRNCTLPTTRYELLRELLLCCIDREVNTRQPYIVYESISSLDDLPDDLREHLSNISKLAYKGIIQNKVVFWKFIKISLPWEYCRKSSGLVFVDKQILTASVIFQSKSCLLLITSLK